MSGSNFKKKYNCQFASVCLGTRKVDRVSDLMLS